ncbi:MAG: flagellar biosynthetic protein FliQ [Myxococcales bacterium]|nr:flagellar biosynthetic protein FliQ [Myxococcales bacterium]
MTIEEVSSLLRMTLYTTLVVSSPILGVALVVGLSVSIIQSATQINEQTLTMVPKIACVFGMFALLFPWIMRTIIDFATQVLVMVAAK